MSVVSWCCVAATLVLGLLLCLVGDAHSSVCCSLPTAVRVPCEHRSDAAAAAAAAVTALAEDNSSGSSEARSTSDVLLDDVPAAEPVVAVSPDITADPSSDEGTPSSDEGTPSLGHVCHEYYCGTVLVEAADTYCSYEPCDPAGCHCAADCIDGSYRTPKWLR